MHTHLLINGFAGDGCGAALHKPNLASSSAMCALPGGPGPAGTTAAADCALGDVANMGWVVEAMGEDARMGCCATGAAGAWVDATASGGTAMRGERSLRGVSARTCGSGVTAPAPGSLPAASAAGGAASAALLKECGVRSTDAAVLTAYAAADAAIDGGGDGCGRGGVDAAVAWGECGADADTGTPGIASAAVRRGDKPTSTAVAVAADASSATPRAGLPGVGAFAGDPAIGGSVSLAGRKAACGGVGASICGGGAATRISGGADGSRSSRGGTPACVARRSDHDV